MVGKDQRHSERSRVQESCVSNFDKQGGYVDSETKTGDEPDLKVGNGQTAPKDKVGLLTRTMPTSFVTQSTQDRREALMGKITRQHYGMEE